MFNKKLAGQMAAAAFVGLVGATQAADAQIGPPPGRLDIYTEMPTAEPGDYPGNWSPRQNVVDIDRYERLIHTSPVFRATRIRLECGSITEAELYRQCVATFY